MVGDLHDEGRDPLRAVVEHVRITIVYDQPVVERGHVKDHLHRVEQTEQGLLHLARVLRKDNQKKIA